MTYPNFGATYSEIPNLTEIDVQIDAENDECLIICSVVGVQQLTTVYTCISCRCNIPSPDGLLDSTKGKCTQCDTTQKLNNPKVAAKLFIQDISGNTICPRANKDVLTKIACKPIFDSDDLLNSSPFNVTYNKYKVITSMLHS